MAYRSAALEVAGGGTGVVSTTAYGLIAGGTTTTGALQTVTPGAANTVVKSGGTGALHSYTTNFKITSDVMTNTSQPSFFAYPSGSSTNATGDGTSVSIAFDTSLYDQSSSYNTSTKVFTAPVAGNYFFTIYIYLSNMISTHTSFAVGINTDATYYSGTNLVQNDSFITANDFSARLVGGSILMKMAAGNVCHAVVSVTGGTKTVTVANTNAFFTGTLLC